MASDIKIDSVAAHNYMRPSTSSNENRIDPGAKPISEVQISNQVNSLTSEILSAQALEIDDTRVNAMIEALKNNEYRVDYNKLAKNLVVELINTSRIPGGNHNENES